MTQYPATRPGSTPAPAPAGGIDLKTLLITAVSSAVAAYTCSRLWAPGTLAAAAFTPVLVAIVREGLAKSTAVVANAVPVRGMVRSARPGDPPIAAGADPGGRTAADLAATAGQPPIGDPVLADETAERVAQPGEISYHGAGTRRRNWRIAIITGLLGFVVAAVVFTVPELLAGESASGGGRSTTLFGGKQRDSATPAVTTTTTTGPEDDVTTTEEEGVTVPQQTVTTPPPVVTTPVDPATTTPAPTTTAPPPAEPPPAEVPPAEVPPG